MGKRKKSAKKSGAKPTAAMVVQHIRMDIAKATASVNRRLNNNPNGYTAAEILAAAGTAGAAELTAHLTSATTTAAALASTAIAVAAQTAATPVEAVVETPQTAS